MKKWFDRLKESLYSALPLLLILGIPISIAAGIWVIINWNDIPVILSRIAELGNGSLALGILLIIFALVGLINAFAAFMLWFKAFTEWLERKAKSYFWFWFSIIIVTFGWYALFKLIKLL